MRMFALLSVAALAGATILDAQGLVGLPGTSRPAASITPRIPPLPESRRADVHRRLMATFQGAGQMDHGFDTLLQLPPLVEAVMPYTIYLSDESSLSPRHRELLALRAAWLCGNQVVWSDHAARARRGGMSAREIHRIAEGPDARGWDPFEATLLRLADELYRNSAVSDATWTRLAASYDQHHLMDAVETVNHFVMLSLMYNTFGVQLDSSAPDRLPTDVAYRVVVPRREPPLAVARVEPLAGDGIAVGRTFARHPTLNAARGRRANFINRVSTLQPRYREMLILRIGWDCRSEYEWAQHVGSVGRARDHGLDPVRIAEGPDAPGWDPLERALLRAVDDLYRDGVISNRTWADLAGRFDTELLMTAVFTASSYRATSMALNAFGVQIEPGNERFPQLPTR